MKIACIILNFNDFETTMELVEKIKDYDVFSKIYVVDGCSTDDSFQKLYDKYCYISKIIIVEADKNGGYGYGNNCGIRLALEDGYQYAIICNPDVEFEEQSIESCVEFIQKHSECVAVAPKIDNGNLLKFASPIKDICFSNLLLNKIVKPRYYHKKYFIGKKWVYVDAIPGSLVLFDINKFNNVGLYDENVFLYHEEVIIGKKFERVGYKSAVLLDQTFKHMHSVSVTKTFKQSIKPRKIAAKSQRYYLEHYLNANIFTLLLFDILQPISYLESFLWTHIKSLWHCVV